jgi:hypothetical protein
MEADQKMHESNLGKNLCMLLHVFTHDVLG